MAKYDGANWNVPEDDFTQTFYSQNLSQFWRPEDISLQSDLIVWHGLSPEIQRAYAQNLLVLTFLDTYQGDIGMPVVSRAMPEKYHQRKAVLNYMASMENAVHAKSYSNIFMTYMGNAEIDELFEWGEQNSHLQRIMELIVSKYRELDMLTYKRNYKLEEARWDENKFNMVTWQAMVASVFLETWLFYSGFFYPLWFYGQGKLMQAGEIINLILRDESIHGLYIGRLAQELFEDFSPTHKNELINWMYELLEALYEQQNAITTEIYAPVNLVSDVRAFVRYNANKALMNLGFDPYFPKEEVNQVVLNGLNTESKTFDFFSMKGNGYQKMESVALSDDDFSFDD